MKQKKNKQNRQSLSRLGKGALIGILVGALSLISTAPTTSRLAEPKPLPQLISYERLASEKANLSKPDVYFVLLNHPQELIGTCTDQERACMEESCRIAQLLYERYNSHSLAPEGIEPGSKGLYETRGTVTLEDSGYDSTGRFYSKIESLINSRNWNLVIGENEQDRAKYEDVKALIHAAYAAPFAKAKKKIESANELEMPKLVEEADKELEKVWNEFFTPEMTTKFYKFGISNRDTSYANACERAKREEKAPVTIIYGSSHILTFTEQLEARGLSYIVIRPESLREIIPVTPKRFKENFRLKLSCKKK